jgi:hypothetical protein
MQFRAAAVGSAGEDGLVAKYAAECRAGDAQPASGAKLVSPANSEHMLHEMPDYGIEREVIGMRGWVRA